ncbi:MAG: formate dehydrogenase subunit alpha [Deltaproteobacteria bacterium]|nr:formate dehydrogenase subunit alpha [Deltaproteobacteria bacterium]
MKRLSQALAAPQADRVAVREVDSVCPYCGVGCALTYGVQEEANRIVYARGREGAANASRLCVKGRFGFDYSSHAQRLTAPWIRRDSAYPKGALSSGVRTTDSEPRAPGRVNAQEVLSHFREATWDEALDRVASRLLEIRHKHGGDALAGFGSAKGTNEEAYLFQKLVRAAFGTNNVDHCTRLCHASSVAALMESFGSAAVTNVVRGVAQAEVALITGCNPTENHPVAATFIKDAATRGTRLLIINPRRPELAQYAELFLQPRSGTDVALYNGMMNVMIAEGLIDSEFIATRTQGFEELKRVVAEYSPGIAARITGVSAEDIVKAARMLGGARRAMFFWGMGVSQHVHGTDNARCLIALAMITGNVGRPGTGLHPLRGQNNVQGASDAGLIPMVYPDYQSVENAAVRARFEKDWGVPLSPHKGLTVTEILAAAMKGEVRGMYIMGENPFLSDPDTNKVRKALSALEFLVVQDIFPTETAEFADVILPASSALEKSGTFTNTDRRVQRVRPAVRPPGQARQDWQLICEIGTRMGFPMQYETPEQIFAEFAASTESYATLSHDALGDQGRWYPCADPATSQGESIVFQKTFPSGKARLVPAMFLPPHELPSGEYPFLLNTGRVLEHWHTGTMTRRSTALDALKPEPYVEMNPGDAQGLKVAEGDWVRVASRRGAIRLRVRLAQHNQPGSVFIPMHFREAAVNALTNPAVDPFGKIPEFKVCAVRIERAEAPQDEAP